MARAMALPAASTLQQISKARQQFAVKHANNYVLKTMSNAACVARRTYAT